MALVDAHAVASQLEETVLQTNQALRRVNTHLEAPTTMVLPSQDVTSQYAELVNHLRQLADEIAGVGSAHEIKVYRVQQPKGGQNTQEAGEERAPELEVVVQTTFAASTPLSQVHVQTEEIKRAFRQAYPTLGAITIHMEPPEEQVERSPRPGQ